MKKEFTHECDVIGCDARTPSSFRRRTIFRETKKYFISYNGYKFKKENGYSTGDWPMYKLDLSTLVEIG